MKTKRNRRLFGIALLGGALALFFLYSFLQPVPSYGGKNANFWFDEYAQPSWNPPRKAAAEGAEAAFRKMGPAAAPFLVMRLKQADSWERWCSGLPDWVKRFLPAEKNWNERFGSAAQLLVKLGADATNVVPQLVRFYSKFQAKMVTTTVPASRTVYVVYTDEWICARILETLGAAGKNNPQALDTLAGALHEPRMARTTVRALVTLGKQDEQVVPRLVEELHNTNNLARSGAAEALGLIGSPAHPAIERLKERVEVGKEADWQVRFKAADALWKIDRQAYAIVPFRIEELQDPSETVRWGAAGFLGEYGKQSEPAVPALIATLKDKSNRVRGRAAMALGQISPAAGEAAPALKEELKDEYSNVREAAEEALKKIESAEVP